MSDFGWLIPIGLIAGAAAWIYRDVRRIQRTPGVPRPKPPPLPSPAQPAQVWTPPPRPRLPRPADPVITAYEWALINDRMAQTKLYAATMASIALGTSLGALMWTIKPAWAWNWLFWVPAAYCWWELVRPAAKDAKTAAARLEQFEEARAFYAWDDD